jgi:hypothetical protein
MSPLKIKIPSKNMREKPTNPFNAGIKSLRATLPAEIFYWGF